jgi:LPXTG-motif cell wall-anchored protein
MNPATHSIYWDLPILIVVVSLVYSATRYDRWDAIVREAALWGLRMAAFLGGIGLALCLLGWWVDSGSSWWVLLAIGGAAALIVGAGFILLSKKREAAP